MIGAFVFAGYEPVVALVSETHSVASRSYPQPVEARGDTPCSYDASWLYRGSFDL